MKILFEDQHIIVCHKEAGLATQSAKTYEKDLVSEIKKHLMMEAKKQNRPIKGEPYLAVVHRLDQPVEGLLVFGKTKEAGSKLSMQLTEGSLNKNYYAIVYGVPTEQDGTLIDYLKKDGTQALVCEKGEADAKKAVLHFSVLPKEHEFVQKKAKTMDNLQECFILDVNIETGRFHQIRAQLSHYGYPILGDTKYGTEESIAYSKEKKIYNVQLLAYELAFRHPKTGKQMEFRID